VKRPKVNTVFITFLGFCVGAAVLTGFGIIYYFFTTVQQLRNSDLTVDNDTMSMVGEFFGGTVGSIWALAGVVLFYLALIYQRRELELQRQELRESRAILENQSKTIALQQFDHTFFQLLNFHLESSRKIQVQDGINGFEQLFKDFQSQISMVKRKRRKDGSAQILDDKVYENGFRSVYDGYKNTLQNYFESYKTLIYFISEKSNDPNFYFSILKTHWSEQEVLIQFYYLIFYTSERSLKPIVEKYHLFQSLPPRYVAEIDKLHMDKVKKSAYSGG